MATQPRTDLRRDMGSWYPNVIRQDIQKDQKPVSDQKVTTGTHSLQPTNGMQRRSFPALQFEIGDDQADLLLQIDHWCTSIGASQNGWIELSARKMQTAFPSWSIKKLQREVVLLAERGYIFLANRCAPKNSKTPLIALNYDFLNRLKSITVQPSFGSDILKLSEPIITDVEGGANRRQIRLCL